MKLIYSETIRKDYRSPYREVRAYYPRTPPYDLPALICLEIGHYEHIKEGDVIDSAQWSIVSHELDSPLTEAGVIRKAQEILAGGTFEELARKYCFELGWIEPRKL